MYAKWDNLKVSSSDEEDVPSRRAPPCAPTGRRSEALGHAPPQSGTTENNVLGYHYCRTTGELGEALGHAPPQSGTTENNVLGYHYCRTMGELGDDGKIVVGNMRLPACYSLRAMQYLINRIRQMTGIDSLAETLRKLEEALKLGESHNFDAIVTYDNARLGTCGFAYVIDEGYWHDQRVEVDRRTTYKLLKNLIDKKTMTVFIRYRINCTVNLNIDAPPFLDIQCAKPCHPDELMTCVHHE